MPSLITEISNAYMYHAHIFMLQIIETFKKILIVKDKIKNKHAILNPLN